MYCSSLLFFIFFSSFSFREKTKTYLRDTSKVFKIAVGYIEYLLEFSFFYDIFLSVFKRAI